MSELDVGMFSKFPPNAPLSEKGFKLLKLGRMVQPSAPKELSRDPEIRDAQGYTRRAVDKFKVNDYQAAVDSICRALQVLEKRKPAAKYPEGGLSNATKADIVEYLLFAARMLECAGQFFSIAESKRKAVDLLSNALSQVSQ